MVPVYYYPGQPSNTISSGVLKCYVGFQNVTSEPLETFDLVDPQGHSWRSPHQTRNNLDYLKIEFVKINPQINRDILVPTLCILSKQTPSHIIHQRGFITSIIQMEIKLLIKGLPTNIPDLEEPWPI